MTKSPGTARGAASAALRIAAVGPIEDASAAISWTVVQPQSAAALAADKRTGRITHGLLSIRHAEANADADVSLASDSSAAWDRRIGRKPRFERVEVEAGVEGVRAF